MNRVARKAVLLPHPEHPAPDIGIGTYCHVGARGIATIGFVLSGAIETIRLPNLVTEPARRDELWQTTCFELFARVRGQSAYTEVNLAPTGDWAAYRFIEYRAGMTADDTATPPALRIEADAFGRVFWFELSSAVLRDPRPLSIGLNAVIEDVAGKRSFWAIRHPPGKPDFHHPDCFARELPAAG